MMRIIQYSSQFKKDVELSKRRQKKNRKTKTYNRNVN